MAKSGGKSKTNSGRTSKASQPNLEAADTGSVDKIRDILFGNQVRDFERRFSQMEERMEKATKDLRDETHKRLEALELFFKKEQDATVERLKSEAKDRKSDDKKLADDLKRTASELKSDIAGNEEKLLELTSELRQQILEQSKTLSEEIQTKTNEASEAARKNAQRLDDAKIDRSTLSEYLIEMAMRISDSTGEPGGDKN